VLLLSTIEVILHAPGPLQAHCCLLQTRHSGSLSPLAHLHSIPDNHASIPPQSFTGRMPFLPPNQQRQSTEGNLVQPNKPNKLNSYHLNTIRSFYSANDIKNHRRVNTHASMHACMYTCVHARTHTYTHTHPFYGPLDSVRDYPGEPVPEPICILLKQETVSGSGSGTLSQLGNYTSTLQLQFLRSSCPFCHTTNSVKALKAQ